MTLSFLMTTLLALLFGIALFYGVIMLSFCIEQSHMSVW